MTTGISGAGRPAERKFRALTGASRPQKASEGDAVIDGHLIEIKSASKTTVNQVRALKYIPLAVLDPRFDQWYLIPPDEIVRRIAQKKRGQHTENPFESATLSLNALTEFRVHDPNNLRQATISAIERGNRWPELRQAMADIYKGARNLADESLEQVRRILAKGPSMPSP